MKNFNNIIFRKPISQHLQIYWKACLFSYVYTTSMLHQTIVKKLAPIKTECLKNSFE